MNNVVAICNQKGGVGKTTTAVNLGASLAALERRVLIVDLDPQANSTSGLGLEKRLDRTMYQALLGHAGLKDIICQTQLPTLFVAPSTPDLTAAEVELIDMPGRERALQKLLAQLPREDEFDDVLIDCPPSLGLLTLNALCAASRALIPLQCEYFALEGLSQLTHTIQLVKQSLNPNLEIEGIVLTMFDARNNLSHQVLDDVRGHFGDRVYKTMIPRNVRLSESPSFGKPVLTYDVTSKGAQAYLQLAQEFLERQVHG